jgi:hypothetical protein
MGQEEQLISFLAYSLVIFPIVNYLMSFKGWKGLMYAIGFLVIVAGSQIIYENIEQGPNHYQLLGASRERNMGIIKKNYKRLSLELHPDKNKAPDAKATFLKVKQAYDVLSDRDLSQTYDLLGDEGVERATQSVIDDRYIITKLVVYYASTLIFAFVMTASDTKLAMSVSLLTLFAMLLIESMLVILKYKPPVWLLPYTTPYDIVSFMHRIFPAIMNGSRATLNNYKKNPAAERATHAVELANAMQESVRSLTALAQAALDNPDLLLDRSESAKSLAGGRLLKLGLVEDCARSVRRRLEFTGATAAINEDMEKLIRDLDNPRKLAAQEAGTDGDWALVGYTVILCVVRYGLSAWHSGTLI